MRNKNFIEEAEAYVTPNPSLRAFIHHSPVKLKRTSLIDTDDLFDTKLSQVHFRHILKSDL